MVFFKITLSFSLFCSLLLASFLLLASANSVQNADGTTSHHLHFKIKYANVTRLCNGTKQIVTVNGQFPGPTVYVRMGDHVNVKVSNHVNENVTIHWHGVRQMFSGWADGPAYITQCPVQPKEHYNHNFTVVREQGTLFWHAHIEWLRGTLYGAFIILPPKGQPYPFPIQPKAGFPLLLGEWWNMDVNEVVKLGLASGTGGPTANATTINGQPGLLYICSQDDATTITVKKGETYLLRVVNAAMNFQMYFQVAKHKLIVVETDASFSKPYTTDNILLAPGQSADVLITADQEVDTYVFGAHIYEPSSYEPYQHTATTGLFIYEGAPKKTVEQLEFPIFPVSNNSTFALEYASSLRSLNSKEYPSQVPQNVDRSFFFTIGYDFIECKVGQVCHGPGPNGDTVGTNVNNVTFVLPSIAILQAYYQQLHANDSWAPKWDTSLTEAKNTYQEDFPSVPLYPYDYTGGNLTNLYSTFGTKVKVVDFKTNVQLILQDTNSLGFGSHPFHLHGHNFYVVGLGIGNYNDSTDPTNFNLVDPPLMNTVDVPFGGWAALRFYTDNPGVWLMHCHLEMHTTLGMMMVWIVKDGDEPNQKLPPPPKDYPKC